MMAYVVSEGRVSALNLQNGGCCLSAWRFAGCRPVAKPAAFSLFLNNPICAIFKRCHVDDAFQHRIRDLFLITAHRHHHRHRGLEVAGQRGRLN